MLHIVLHIAGLCNTIYAWLHPAVQCCRVGAVDNAQSGAGSGEQVWLAARGWTALSVVILQGSCSKLCHRIRSTRSVSGIPTIHASRDGEYKVYVIVNIVRHNSVHSYTLYMRAVTGHAQLIKENGARCAESRENAADHLCNPWDRCPSLCTEHKVSSSAVSAVSAL